MSARTGNGAAARRLWLRAALVWLALTTLLAATIVFAYLPLGAWKLPVALIIAATKVGLVAWIFMELRTTQPISRFAVASGFLLAAVLMSLVFAEEATRSHVSGPFPEAETAGR